MHCKEDVTLTSCPLPDSIFTKDPSIAMLWRGPEGDVLLPGTNKYRMEISTTFDSGTPESSGIGNDSNKGCNKIAELSITDCQWIKDSGDYTLSVVSSTSEEILFLYTITLIITCKYCIS